jgi:cobalt-zinc-cadmium efflux system outer membrane protein
MLVYLKYITKILILFAFILFSFDLYAEETEADLLQALLKNNPEITAVRYKYFAATNIPSQEGALPDPMIGFTDFGVGHPFSKLNDSDFAYKALGVSQELPFPGKLSLRSKIADQRVLIAEQEYFAIGIRLISEFRSGLAEYRYQSQAIENAEKYRDLLDQLTEISESRYRIGEGLQQDVLRTQIERSILEEKLDLLRKDRESQQSMLNALLNRDPEQPLEVHSEPAQIEVDLSLSDLQARLQSLSPEFLIRSIGEKEKTLAVDLAKKELYPDFTASFQWQKTGSDFPDYYMTAIEARIPLFGSKRQQPAIAQANLELKSSQKEKEATLRKLESQLKNAYLTLTTNARLLRLYDEGIIPQTRMSLESSLSAYQVGKIDFLSVLNNASTLLNYETEYHRRLADYEKAIAQIEQITGSFLQPAPFELRKELKHE